MYFSGVLRGDWPRGVDARPLAQPTEDAASALSESRDGQTENSPPVSKKVRGKRAMADEPVRKKRKTVAASPLKPGGILLGGDQTTQQWRTTMLEWSDDDETLVAPLPSTKAPPRNTRAEEQARRGEEVLEQQAMGVPKQQTTRVHT